MTRVALEFVRVLRQLRLHRDQALRGRARAFRRFMAEAVQASAFHRDRFHAAGVDPRVLEAPEQLASVPLMERADLCGHLDAIQSSAIPATDRRELRTSGSSGVPLKVWVGRRESATRQALQLRARWLAGRRPLQREAVIGTYGGAARSRARGPMGRSLYLSALDPPEEIRSALAAFRPQYLVAMPSTLLDLGEEPGLRPKLITTGAEVLEPEVRSVIETRFGAPVRDVYGAIETGLLAFECSEGDGYHLNADEVYFEFLPAGGEAPGAFEIVVTPLYARATPLVRYRLGDFVRPLPGLCRCGSWLPRIAAIDGRRDDCCARPDGTLIAPATIRALFRQEEPFRAYRVTQMSDGNVRLELTGHQGDDRQARSLATGLSHLVGRPVALAVLPTLPRDQSGKRRAIRRMTGELAA